MSETAYCPECDSRLRFTKKIKKGDTIECYECGEELEVVSTNPFELAWAMGSGYGDDDDFDFDDDDDDDNFDLDYDDNLMRSHW